VLLIIFGVTIIIGGMYWALWDGTRSFISFLVLNDVYYELAFFIWRMIPIVMLFVGILCLIVSATSIRNEKVVYE